MFYIYLAKGLKTETYRFNNSANLTGTIRLYLVSVQKDKMASVTACFTFRFS